MIRSWKGRSAEAVFQGRIPKGFPADLFGATRRKPARLDAATSLDDLRSPPGNQLHALTGNRKGQWSIRVNDQFRICFVRTSSGPENVEFVDYH
jgi:proteic killer suppression protein